MSVKIVLVAACALVDADGRVLIACGVSIAVVAAVTSIGSTMNTLYYDKLLNMF